MVMRTRWLVVLACLALVTVALAAVATLRQPDAVAADDTPAFQPSLSSGEDKRPLEIVVVSDSFTGGTSEGGFGKDSWAAVLGVKLRAAGYPVTVRPEPHASTGYVTRGFDAKTFGEVAGEVIDAHDDLVIFYGSVNDGSQPPATVEAAAKRAYQLAHRRAPNAGILSIGVPLAFNGNDAVVRRVQAGLRAAAEQTGTRFIDPLADGWFSGKNAKLLSSDGVHPNNAGHRRTADLVYRAILPSIKKMASRPAGTKKAETNDLTVTADRAHARAVQVGPGNVVSRSLRGSCEDGVTPQLDVSDQKGSSFLPVPLPVSEILGVVPSTRTPGRIGVVGPATDCDEPLLWSSSDSGLTWSSDDASDEWYQSGASAGEVHAPGGDVEPGCDEVVVLSVTDADQARVACADGTIRGTLDGGRSWSRLGALDKIRAMDFESPSQGIALAPLEGCAATVFRTDDGGRTWTSSACLTGRRGEAVAMTRDAWYAMVSNTLYSSDDQGGRWRPAGIEPAEEGS